MEKNAEGEQEIHKYFSEKEYSTIIVSREGVTKKQNELAELIDEILDKELSRQELENIFSQLKQGDAQKLLVEAIQIKRRDSDKAKLCAACWECGLDFRNNFLFFCELACSKDFLLAMEALTVVQNIEGSIGEEELKKALIKAEDCGSPNKEIIGDLIENLKARMV